MGLTKRELEEINDTLQFRLAETERELGEKEAENQSLTAQLQKANEQLALLARRYTQLSEFVERWSAYWNEELSGKVTR